MQPPKKLPPPAPRPLRFGMRARVTAPGHFYEGLCCTLLAAACHEPMYQVSLDYAPELECWIQGDCLTPLDQNDPDYVVQELEGEPEVLVELDQD